MFPRMREAYRGNPLSASYSAALSGPAKQYWADPLHKSTYCMQLFPGRSAAHMDAIFGEDARHEAFSPLNGLFVHSNVRKALEMGYMAIVPDGDPLLSRIEYKLVVLDPDQKMLQENYWSLEVLDVRLRLEPQIDKSAVGFESLRQLDRWRLQFLSDFRPSPRYVWWLYLRSIAVFSWRVARLRLDIQVKKEAELLSATQCWGTNGKYVKKAQLLGFVEELGLDDAMAMAVVQHAIEEEGEEGRKAEPDMTALAVICDDVIRSA